jgi:hypothetical protein
MKTWTTAARDAALSGGLAGLTSLAALAVGGRRDDGAAAAPINAPSHAVFGDVALRQDRPGWRYTATGAAIHMASAFFWALLHEKLRAERGTRGAARALSGAAATTAVAAIVDLAVVPRRLSPGFQERLRTSSLTWVYVAFGIGLAAGSWWLAQRRGR